MITRNSYPKKIVAKKGFCFVWSVLLFIMLGCHSLTSAAATPTPQPILGVDELHFKDSVIGQRFRSLDGYIHGMMDKTWRTTSYQLIGNFYESRWCSGAGASPDCQIAEVTYDNHNQHVLDLYTLFYSQDYPQVFGLGFQSLWVPKTAGWGASFSFSEGGGRVVGEGWGVNFKEYRDLNVRPESILSLGNSYRYPIYQSSIDYSSGLPIRKDLELYLANPEAMRDRGLTQIHALAQKVKDEISTHQVMTCDLQPYKGGGIPPECKSRSMTTIEEYAELARAETYFANQEQLLNDHYQDMYAAWMSAFPMNQYWH